MFSLKRSFMLRITCLLGVVQFVAGSQGLHLGEKQPLASQNNLSSPLYEHNFGSPLYQVATKKSIEARRSAFPEVKIAIDQNSLSDDRKDEPCVVVVYDSDSGEKSRNCEFGLFFIY